MIKNDEFPLWYRYLLVRLLYSVSLWCGVWDIFEYRNKPIHSVSVPIIYISIINYCNKTKTKSKKDFLDYTLKYSSIIAFLANLISFHRIVTCSVNFLIMYTLILFKYTFNITVVFKKHLESALWNLDICDIIILAATHSHLCYGRFPLIQELKGISWYINSLLAIFDFLYQIIH